MAKRKSARTRFAEAVGELGLEKSVELLEFLAIVQQDTRPVKPGRATGRKAVEEELKRRGKGDGIPEGEKSPGGHITKA